MAADDRRQAGLGEAQGGTVKRAEFQRTEERVDTLRSPPHSAEAEQAVLGAAMLAPEALLQVGDLLREEMFYRRDHRLIYRAMRAQLEKDQPIDAVTLGEWFESKGLAEQIAGTSYLIELASNTPSAANIRAYAEIVREKYQLRRLIEVGTGIVNTGFNPDGKTSTEVIGEAASAVGQVLEQRAIEVESINATLKSVFEGLCERSNSDSDLAGLSTGFPDLDNLLGGLEPGRVYGIGSRPKMGKSILAKDIAEAVGLTQEKHVGVWTMEMTRKEYVSRIICSQGQIEAGALKHPKLMNEDHWAKMHSVMARLRDAPLHLFDAPDTSIEMIEAQARVLKAKGKLDLIVIDYLGLLRMPNADTKAAAVGEVTRAVKVMAGRLEVPVILVFQLNRNNETGIVRPPRASDARDSGAIEQDLDVMMMLHRPSYYSDDAPPGLRLEVVIARNGPTGVIKLDEELGFCRFLPSRDEWKDPVAQTGAGRGHGKGHRRDNDNGGF